MGDAHFVKLFRLGQLSIEYLIYTQNYLETLTKSLDVHYKQAFEDVSRMREQFKGTREENDALRRELKLKNKTLSTYEYLLKLPSQQESDMFKCNQCAKVFISKEYVQRHYQRHHPTVNFTTDFKAPKASSTAVKPALTTAQVAAE